MQGGPQNCTQNSWPQFCQILAGFQNAFAGRFSSIFAVKWSLLVPPHLAYVVTLHRESLMPVNKRLTINYKVVYSSYILKVWWG